LTLAFLPALYAIWFRVSYVDAIPVREFHDETLPAEGAKTAHFCSMRITDDVRKYAAKRGMNEGGAVEEGLKQKPAEFKEAGAEIYAKA
jgi:phosphomethylpyrimidine synthase